ncbi:MAG: cytochrome ubiquinol oxidase subunit I, partial [Verrucomicrobiota bacterium]
MDVLILSRIQFGLTIGFHYIYPPLSIGLGVMLVIIEAAWLRTGDPVYHQMARFWTKVFALTFAIGVATGIVMEFEFGTNWATYSRFVGDVFGSALAAEGIFAFFLESGFLAVLLFGWDKVGRKLHFFSTCMVCLGAHFSAVWIVVANSWMQTPAGYHIVGQGMHARAQVTDFWQVVFNPSFADRLFHTLCGAWSAGAF